MAKDEMKTRFLIIVCVVIIISISTAITINYLQFEEGMEDSIQNNPFVKNCIPAGPEDVIPAIGIENHTHKFDLRNCQWIKNQG